MASSVIDICEASDAKTIFADDHDYRFLSIGLGTEFDIEQSNNLDIKSNRKSNLRLTLKDGQDVELSSETENLSHLTVKYICSCDGLIVLVIMEASSDSMVVLDSKSLQILQRIKVTIETCENNNDKENEFRKVDITSVAFDGHVLVVGQADGKVSVWSKLRSSNSDVVVQTETAEERVLLPKWSVRGDESKWIEHVFICRASTLAQNTISTGKSQDDNDNGIVVAIDRISQTVGCWSLMDAKLIQCFSLSIKEVTKVDWKLNGCVFDRGYVVAVLQQDLSDNDNISNEMSSCAILLANVESGEGGMIGTSEEENDDKRLDASINGRIIAVDFNEGVIVAGWNKGVVTLWNASKKYKGWRKGNSDGIRGEVGCVKIIRNAMMKSQCKSHDSYVVTGGADGVVNVYGVENGDLLMNVLLSNEPNPITKILHLGQFLVCGTSKGNIDSIEIQSETITTQDALLDSSEFHHYKLQDVEGQVIDSKVKIYNLLNTSAGIPVHRPNALLTRGSNATNLNCEKNDTSADEVVESDHEKAKKMDGPGVARDESFSLNDKFSRKCGNETCIQREILDSGDNGKFKRCGQCKMVYYCSEHCQRTHWRNGHKKTCKVKNQTSSTIHNLKETKYQSHQNVSELKQIFESSTSFHNNIIDTSDLANYFKEGVESLDSSSAEIIASEEHLDKDCCIKGEQEVKSATYEVTQKIETETESERKMCIVTVSLPHLTSALGISAEVVDEYTLVLSIPSLDGANHTAVQHSLDVRFVSAVDADSCTISFKKKAKKLVVRVRILE